MLEPLCGVDLLKPAQPGPRARSLQVGLGNSTCAGSVLGAALHVGVEPGGRLCSVSSAGDPHPSLRVASPHRSLAPRESPVYLPAVTTGKQTNRCVGMKGEGHSPGPGRHTDLSVRLCPTGLLAPQREAGAMVSGGPVMRPSLAQQVEAAGGPSRCLRDWGGVEDVPCVRATSRPALTQEPQPCDSLCPGTPALPVFFPLNQT